MNEIQNTPQPTVVKPVEPVVVKPTEPVRPVVNPNPVINPLVKPTVINPPVINPVIDKPLEHIDEVQPGKLKAVGRTKADGPIKLGAIVLFEGKIPAIVTGVWGNDTLNLTLFPDALPMLDVKVGVPLYKKGDITNTWQHLK